MDNTRPRKRTIELAVLTLAVLPSFLEAVSAQTSVAPASAARLRIQGGAEISSNQVIRDALNRACLDVEAASRTQKVNPRMIDHLVSVKNRCPRLIRVKICYLETDRCKSFSVGSFGREDVILGSMIDQSSFRYSLFQN